MSMSRNSHNIQIIGNLGKDPEMRYTPSGQPVTSFSVATSSRWKTEAGEQREQTVWWKITAWGKQAELCNEYLKKGAKVYLEGNIKVDPVTNEPHIWTSQEGTPRATLEVTLQEIKFLDKKGEGAGQVSDPGPGEPPPPGGSSSPVPPEDDIPF